MTNNWHKPDTKIQHYDSGALLSINRERAKSGTIVTERGVRMGPNHIHVFITHPDGSITDCGVSKNLLTNIGRDWLCEAIGGVTAPAGSPATAVTATSVTATGTPFTASNLATPQLGLAGKRIQMPVTNITTSPVYGNIVSNTTSVICDRTKSIYG